MDRVQSICPFCSLGCGLELLVDEGRVVGVEYLLKHPNEGALCTRGNTCYELVHHPERVRYPLIREGNAFRRASWSEALSILADRLRYVQSNYGPQAIGVIASTRTSNEDCYVMQKFARIALKTANIDNPARLTHAPTLKLLAGRLGYPWATATLELIEGSDLVLIVGANPLEVNPVLARRILRAKDLGAAVIVVDPRRTKTASKSNLHVQVRPGRDFELLLSMINVFLTNNMAEEEALEKWLPKDVVQLSQKLTPEEAEGMTGVSSKLIREVALRLALSKKPIIMFSHGITQQQRSFESLLALLALGYIAGAFSKGGVFPLTDQVNMQGSCDVGCLADYGPGYAETVEGLTLAEMVEAAGKGEVKALIVVGCDVAASLPDPSSVKCALQKLELLAVVDLFPSETSELAHIVLPTLTWAEYDGTYTNIEGRVQRAYKAVDPQAEAKPVWLMFSELAKAMGLGGFEYSSWIDVFQELKSSTNCYSNLTVEGVSKVGGQLACAARRLSFTFKPLNLELSSTGDKDLTLIAGRTMHHLDSGELTRRLSFAMKQVPEQYVEVPQTIAATMGLLEGDEVEVEGGGGSLIAKARLAPKGLDNVLFMPIHFPKCSPLSLIGFKLHPITKAPQLKHAPVKLARRLKSHG